MGSLLAQRSVSCCYRPVKLLARAVDDLRWRLGLTAEARSKRLLRRHTPNPGEIALDCGANVGEFTELLAQRGGEVYAFEPNPFAFEVLRKRMEKFTHVHCYQAAVAAGAGRRKLYFHKNSALDEVHWSNGSSLLDVKPNVDATKYVEVEAIDLADFVRSLGRSVKVLKMDIEGAEVEVLERLADTGAMDLIGCLFVETHENKIPQLAEPTARLRQRLAGRRIHWAWV